MKSMHFKDLNPSTKQKQKTTPLYHKMHMSHSVPENYLKLRPRKIAIWSGSTGFAQNRGSTLNKDLFPAIRPAGTQEC